MSAADEEVEDEVAEKSSEPSLIVLIAAVVVLTLVAAGAGLGLGMLLPSQPAEMEQQQAALESGETEPEETPEYASGESIMMLQPVITNLIEPRGTYIRLEGAAVFAGPTDKQSEVLVSRVAQDIMSVLNTMSLAQIEGPSGLQHLREDLNARAVVRSEGKIKEIVLHSVVVE